MGEYYKNIIGFVKIWTETPKSVGFLDFQQKISLQNVLQLME